jgi:hypothetical protein
MKIHVGPSGREGISLQKEDYLLIFNGRLKGLCTIIMGEKNLKEMD